MINPLHSLSHNPPAAVAHDEKDHKEAGQQPTWFWAQFFHGLIRQIEELRTQMNNQFDELRSKIEEKIGERGGK